METLKRSFFLWSSPHHKSRRRSGLWQRKRAPAFYTKLLIKKRTMTRKHFIFVVGEVWLSVERLRGSDNRQHGRRSAKNHSFWGWSEGVSGSWMPLTFVCKEIKLMSWFKSSKALNLTTHWREVLAKVLRSLKPPGLLRWTLKKIQNKSANNSFTAAWWCRDGTCSTYFLIHSRYSIWPTISAGLFLFCMNVNCYLPFGLCRSRGHPAWDTMSEKSFGDGTMSFCVCM